jgi:signal recognition particle receptor subunit beta
MAFVYHAGREIQCKIVYYGPARSGKTTNLKYIYAKIPNNVKGKLISTETKHDSTLFFDFLALDLGPIRDFNIRIQLYTVPGQVHHDASRKMVLRGVDGVVFVADSLQVRREKNVGSLQNLIDNLQDEGIQMGDIPLIMQYNKRDLRGGLVPTLPLGTLEEDLNAQLKVPSFPASAMEGYRVFDTLRAIAKWVAKDVSRRILSSGEPIFDVKAESRTMAG